MSRRRHQLAPGHHLDGRQGTSQASRAAGHRNGWSGHIPPTRKAGP